MPTSSTAPSATADLGTDTGVTAVISHVRPGDSSCTCGASQVLEATAHVERARRLAGLVSLDRAVDAGQVTGAEVNERRVQLLSR